MKYVIVPQEDIDRLEEARINLWKLEPYLMKHPATLQYISQPMWLITHKKYKETLMSKIKRRLGI